MLWHHAGQVQPTAPPLFYPDGGCPVGVPKALFGRGALMLDFVGDEDWI